MALWQNYLYVAESDSVKRYPYDPVKLTAGKGQEVIPLKGFNDGHWTRTLLFDRAGQKLYVGVGSASNVDTGEDPRRAAINRYNPDGSGHELYATGTRNPTALHWYPNSDTLWAAVQERDKLGDDLVPDYFTHVQQGGFYGWPYAYFGSESRPASKAIQARSRRPKRSLRTWPWARTWPCSTSPSIKASSFLPSIKVARSWLSTGPGTAPSASATKLAFVPFKEGKPTDGPRGFLTGWMLSPDDTRVWGRPVGSARVSRWKPARQR